MRGVSSVPALTAAVRAQGGSAVALTDTNGLYGAIRFVEEARRAGLRPVLGAELVTDDHRAVLLAKTAEGYANLCRILSARHCEASFDFIETVTRHRTGLIILTDDEPALVRILKEPKNSLVRQYQTMFEFEDVKLRFTDEATRAVAREALKRNVGARGLRVILEEIMLELMYTVPSQRDISEVVITEETVLNRTQPITTLRKAG